MRILALWAVLATAPGVQLEVILHDVVYESPKVKCTYALFPGHSG